MIIILDSCRGRGLGLSELIFHLLEGLSLPLPGALDGLRTSAFLCSETGCEEVFCQIPGRALGQPYSDIHSLIDFLFQTLKYTRKDLPPCVQDGCWPFPLSLQKGIKGMRGVGCCRLGPRTSCLFGGGSPQPKGRHREPASGQGLPSSRTRTQAFRE